MPDILSLLLCLHPALSKTTIRQLARIVQAILVMPARINQLSIARWAGKGASYRSVQRFFHTDIDWLQVKWLFFILMVYVASDIYLLVGDETVVKKAGKATFGLDRFFSSLAGKPVPGIAFFTFALVNVQKRQAYTLVAHQVVRTQQEKQEAAQRTKLAAQRKQKARDKEGANSQPKSPGRPKGSKNKNKEQVTFSPELLRILGWAQQIMALVGKKIALRHLVLDGHFGNHPAYQMTRQLGLHLISKMRNNAHLYLLPDEKYKQEHPRCKYGGRLDYESLPAESLVSSKSEEGMLTKMYQMRCRHKDFAEVLNVVVIHKTHLASGRVGHVVLFSSDLDLEAAALVDYYALRYQIEFEFRDAKQHWGLSDFVCVGQTSVTNAVGLSLFLGNLSSHLLVPLREDFPDAGVCDLKSYYRGRRYALETLKAIGTLPCLPESLKRGWDFADPIVWETVLVPHFVSLHGWVYFAVKEASMPAKKYIIALTP
ncbi:transposase, partial [Armatimonas sp.]|uniref:transposase n=1 Tax=Armatimonas sp. TaxID=1872638 RepID=UPI0037507E82